jgi:hypothetical protein
VEIAMGSKDQISISKQQIDRCKYMTPTEKFRHMCKELSKQESVKKLMENLKNK